MKIVINSHDKSSIALNHLLESMKMFDGYDDYEIIVFIGGHYDNADYEFSKNKNITYAKCNYNSIDITSFIALVELYGDNTNDYYLYLHDTCRVGSEFYKKIKSIDLTNVSSIRINKYFSMNIGIYSQKIINKFKDFLLSNKIKEKSKVMELKKNNNITEDYIFNNDKNNILLDDYSGWSYTGPTDYYSTGTMRIVEYYPNLDLYKMKANWGGAGTGAVLEN